MVTHWTADLSPGPRWERFHRSMATLFYLQPLHLPQGLNVFLPELLHLLQVLRVRQRGLLTGRQRELFSSEEGSTCGAGVSGWSPTLCAALGGRLIVALTACSQLRGKSLLVWHNQFSQPDHYQSNHVMTMDQHGVTSHHSIVSINRENHDQIDAAAAAAGLPDGCRVNPTNQTTWTVTQQPPAHPTETQTSHESGFGNLNTQINTDVLLCNNM